MASPIHSLPAETLGAIFEFCAAPIANPGYIHTLDNYPLVLTRVCRRWRCVAFDDPWLWTELALDPTDYSSPNLPIVIPYWFRNSHSLPLSIAINFKHANCWTSESRLHKRVQGSGCLSIIHLIRTELPRCRSLALFLDDAPTAVSFLKLLFKGSIFLPNLEVFILQCTTRYPPNCGTIYIPNIRILVTNDWHMPVSFRTGTTRSCESLRSFTASNIISSSDILSAFTTLPMLENVHLTFHALTLSSRVVRTILPSLTSLALHWHDPVPIEYVLKVLDVPLLESLQLHFLTSTMSRPMVYRALPWQQFDLSNVTHLDFKSLCLWGVEPLLTQAVRLESLILNRCLGVEDVLMHLISGYSSPVSSCHFFSLATLASLESWFPNLVLLISGVGLIHSDNVPCLRLHDLEIIGGVTIHADYGRPLLNLIRIRGLGRSTSKQRDSDTLPRSLRRVALTVSPSECVHGLPIATFRAFGVQVDTLGRWSPSVIPFVLEAMWFMVFVFGVTWSVKQVFLSLVQ